MNNAIDNALEAIRHANPVPDPVDLADAMLRSDVFLTTTKETSMSIDTDQPTDETPAHRQSGRRRKLLALVGAFAMPVVVVVGAAVLLAPGDGDDPSPTAPASVLGPTAVYDGETCVYDGPSEFDVGSTVTFTVTNESENLLVGFSVWWFPSGVAPETIHEQGIYGATGFEDENMKVNYPPTALGVPKELTVTFNNTGQHGLNCFDTSGGEHNGFGLDYVTMFTVKG